MKRLAFRILALIIFLVVIFLASYQYLVQDIEFGGQLKQEEKVALLKSPHYHLDHFENTTPAASFGIWDNLLDFFGGQERLPPSAFPILIPQWSSHPSSALKVYWLGHATAVIELEGKRIITDPMLSHYAFPVELVAPKRYNPPPVKAKHLPKIDIALISHDHFDHLDMKSVQSLAKDGTHFFVGLGIGSYLALWGVPKEQIHEKDWWDKSTFMGLDIHCTPARHYSGRKAMDNSTLWASWLVKGQQYSMFHSGDTGYGRHFQDIFKRLGQVDLALMKIGDYGRDLGWQDTHMTPEQAVKAHQDLHGKIFLPIRWGTFNLSNHAWDEPIKRALAAALSAGIAIVTPMMGEAYSFGDPIRLRQWWTQLED